MMNKKGTGRKPMLCGSLSSRHGSFSGCGWRRRPHDMEGN